MGASREDRQSHFFKWLSRSVSSAQLSELYQAFIELEEALSAHRYFNHLSQSLAETVDASEVDRLYYDLSANKEFKRLYKSSIKLSLLRHYARYCRENKNMTKTKSSKEAISTGDILIDRLEKDGIPYVDNRSKKGALWISKSAKTEALLRDFRVHGIQFSFSPSKQQWWTRDASPKESVSRDSVDPTMIKARQQAFFEWLKQQDYDSVELFSIYGTARKIQAMLLGNHESFGLFGLYGLERIQACAKATRNSAEFIQRDRQERGLWTKTIDCYLRFAKEQEENAHEPSIAVREKTTTAPYKVIPYSTEKKTSETQNMESALSAILKDDQFSELREALSRKGIYKMEELKRLNLWVFMNQNGLYNIGQRQTIYSAVRRALEANSQSNEEIHWKLVTIGKEYTGVTPANALMEYCRAIAMKYPLKVRNLIGSRMQTTGLIPLMSMRIHADDPALEHPKAFLNSKIDAETAMSFARWIANQCHDNDMPQSMISEASASKSSDASDAVKDKPVETSDKTTVARCDMASASLDTFRSWLLINQHFAERTAGNYWTSIRMIEEYIKRNKFSFSLLKADADQAQRISDILLARPDFVRINDARHHQFSAALSQFILFLQEGETTSPYETSVAMPVENSSDYVNPTKSTMPSALQQEVEKLVLDADLEGITLDQLYDQISSIKMVALKQIRDDSPKLVDMGNKLVHVDAFVDLEEAAEKLKDILEKLLTKNNGYVSSAQLWEYVRTEMHMFLNDNDIRDEKSVYYIARHLFEKTRWRDTCYSFTGGNHISRGGKDALTTNLDVIYKFARENNGFFRYDDLVEYLEKVGIPTGNLRGQMRIGDKPYFFYYSSDELISAESIGIDDRWLAQAKQALARLFEDMGDHVVLRAINQIWYEQLPTLPGYIQWTPLLLQYILVFYGEKLGAKTIGAELNQKYNVLHAMLVTQDSIVQTFADAVVAYLVDNEIEQRQFDAEELRGMLGEGGLIAGNELIWHMPKAIGSDPRFAWDMSGNNVKVQV